MARHDLHLGRRIEREFILGREEVKLRKLFYALRPAAALRWLARHPERAVAPMAPPVLMVQSDPPPEVAEAVAALIARKAVTREMVSASGLELGLAGLGAFIRGEFEAAAGWETAEPPAPAEEARGEAAELYRGTVERLDAEAAGR